MSIENNQATLIYPDDTSIRPIPPESPAYPSSPAILPQQVNDNNDNANSSTTIAIGNSLNMNMYNNNSNPSSTPQAATTANATMASNISLDSYHDNPSDTFISSTTTPLLYTSFETQDEEDVDVDADKCGLSDDEEGFHMRVSSSRSATKLWIAIVIACFFFVTELVGGLIAGSLALLSDSFHLLSDVVSFAISLLSIYLARRPATQSLSYGYHRAEILGALISIIIIWILTATLCFEAYHRIQHPKPVDGKTMSFVAAIGVVVNVVLMLVLGHEHHHGHGDAHNKHSKGDNVNVRAALLHVLGDLLSSLGVLISSIIIIFDETKVWVDPLCTFIFSALVMATTFGVWSSGIRILMEATPSHIDSNAVRMDLEAIDGVKSVHDLHIWDLTVGKTTLTAHLRLREYKPDIQAEPYSHSSILSQARHLLKRKYGISQVTIQIDT